MAKVGIIDHVGVKAGMDYYSISLAKSLSKHLPVFLFSNVSSAERTYDFKLFNFFQSSNNNNKLFQFLYFFIAYVKSIVECKRSGVSHIVVHVFSSDIVAFILCVFSKLLNFNVILICHDAESFTNNDSALISKWIYGFGSDVVNVHNNISKEVLLQSGVQECKVNVIRHGNFIDLFKKTELNVIPFNLNPDFKYLLFFGQIKKVKGLDVLLRALPNIDPSIKLIIAGKVWKDDFSVYQDIITELNLEDRVLLHIRFISDPERDFLFRNSDVIVIPYKKIFQSGVLLMAMSYQLPVIASNLRGNEELVEDGVSGLLFQSGSSEALTNKINQFFGDNSTLLRSELALNAYQKCEKEYSWEQISRLYLEIFKS